MSEKLQKLRRLLEESQLDALVLNPGPSLTYLTRLDFHLMERPVLTLFTRDEVQIVLPKLELAKLNGLDFDIQFSAYADDPATWQSAFNESFSAFDKDGFRLGVEPARLRLLELGYLSRAMPKAELVDASELTGKLRINKGEFEVLRMRKAAQIAEEALLKTLATVRVGQTEREIASELVIQLLRAGSDPGLPFHPIVSIGENSANPHASPGDRKLQEGDILLIDYGASFQGYYSDITRSFFCGDVCEEFRTIAELVYEANLAVRTHAKAGMTAGEADALARQVISAGGYGEYFIHRTGHGLGMETHEEPYIFSGSPLVLEEGMVFTDEPGIYLPGKGGIRIEDDLLVTAQGVESLTSLPRRVLPLSFFRE